LYQKPKERIQVAPRRKAITDDHLPNPGGKAWVLSEPLSGTAQFSIDGESPAKKKKKRGLDSQVSRYDPVKLVETALENE
jgi:hypothetical protein